MKQPLKEALKRIGGDRLLKESTWANRKFGEPLPTMADYKKAHEGKINEAFEIEDVQDYEARVFDAIAEFKKVFEKSEFKKSGHARKLNSIIKQMFKLEQQLSDVTQELE